MKELSIFIDESGDFGEYNYQSPYYIISMVMHEQSLDISKDLKILESELSYIGYENHCIHAGPVIRQEAEYRHVDIELRRRIIKQLMTFVRKIDIKCNCAYIEKRHIKNEVEAAGKLSKQISMFIYQNYDYFLGFDIVKIYYDNGQVEVNKILSSVFNALLDNVEFKKVLPSEYRLFQVADLLCTIKLSELKMERKCLSKSEILFFEGERTLRKNYVKPLKKKEI